MTKLIPYTSNKRQTIIPMVAEFYAEHYSISEYEHAEVTPERMVAAEEDFDEWFEKDSPAVFFIEEDGEEAGLIFMAKHGGSVVWIENLYVKPEFRRRGIATRAIGLAEEYAINEMKAPAVNIDVIPQNIDAIRLYHSLGYDTLHMITLRKHVNGNNRTVSTKILGHEFKI